MFPASLLSVFLYAGLLCLLASSLLSSVSQLSSPLLCGPAVIILRPLRFTVMSPHLRLIVFPSQFLTQSIFNTFFLLELNLGPSFLFPQSAGSFLSNRGLICINIFTVSHFFPPDVIAFDCCKTSSVPLPCDWK